MKAVCWEGRTNVRLAHVPDPALINPRGPVIAMDSVVMKPH